MKKKIDKSIIIGIPQHFSLNNIFANQLIQLGFTVYDISIPTEEFRYKNIIQRAYNLYRKIFFKDYDYKNKLKIKFIEDRFIKKLNNLPQNVDYALFIRPDLFPLPIIEEVKHKTQLIVGYQWDGLKRYPNIYSRINLFDRFFVFDSNDLTIQNTLPLTNFYLDHPISNHKVPPSIPLQSDILFIGTYIEERMSDIYKFFNTLAESSVLKINALININKPSDKLKVKDHCPHLVPIETPLDYFQNITLAKNTKVLTDFSNYQHDGLSFRVFEAIGFEKKLITTQKSLLKYDFYNANNMLLIDNDTTIEDIMLFIKLPYKEISHEIKLKYGFTNWIKYILNIDTHTKINLPVELVKE